MGTHHQNPPTYLKELMGLNKVVRHFIIFYVKLSSFTQFTAPEVNVWAMTPHTNTTKVGQQSCTSCLHIVSKLVMYFQQPKLLTFDSETREPI